MSSAENDNREKEPNDLINTAPSYDFSDSNTEHDRVLVVEGKKFHVLSGLLSPWSEYFKELFSSNFKDEKSDEIEIQEVSAEDFKDFLNFIYPSRLDVNEDNVVGLAKMTQRFLAPGVMVDCKIFIENYCNTFDDHNLLELLKLAIKFNLTEIKERIGDRIHLTKAKSYGKKKCSWCRSDPNDGPCPHNEDEPDQYKKFMVKRFVHKNAKRISKLSSETQSYILQASVGNVRDIPRDKETDSEEEEEDYFGYSD